MNTAQQALCYTHTHTNWTNTHTHSRLYTTAITGPARHDYCADYPGRKESYLICHLAMISFRHGPMPQVAALGGWTLGLWVTRCLTNESPPKPHLHRLRYLNITNKIKQLISRIKETDRMGESVDHILVVCEPWPSQIDAI